jgi:hypothetical protein
VLLHAAGVGLVHWIGSTLGPVAATGVAAVMVAVSAAAALGWAALRAPRRSA